jgi:hypothetical protein
MGAPEMWCPSCNGLLKQATDRAGLLECVDCHTLYSPQPERSNALDVLGAVLVGIGKIILLLAGLMALGLGVIFAGCLLMSRMH